MKIVRASYKNILGDLLFKDHRFTEAFDLQLEAQKVFEKTGYDSIPEIGYYLHVLGSNYYYFEDYPKSIEFLKLAEKYPSFIQRYNIGTYNTQGMAYQKMKNYSLAKEKFLATINLAKEYNDSVWIGIASGNYGYTMSLEGNYQEAINYLLQDYNLNKIAEPQNTSITCIYLANCYLHSGRMEDARYYLNEGLRLQLGLSDPVFWNHYYVTAAGFHAAAGDYAKAYRYADSAMALKDSLKVMFNSNILASAERRIETETQLANEKLAEEKDKSQRLERNLVIFSLVAAFAFIFFYFRQKNRGLIKDKKLLEQKEQLLSADNEIMKEKLSNAENQLSSYLKNISEKNDMIDKISAELSDLQVPDKSPELESKLTQKKELSQFSILTENDWTNFKQLFDNVYPNFFIRIKENFADFTPAETRLPALLKLKLSHREMSSMLGISADTITKSKYRLRKKLMELNINKELEQLVTEL